MSKGIRFTDEFKQDAVAQVVERGYAVSEVAERLGAPHFVPHLTSSDMAQRPARFPETVARDKRGERGK